MFDGWRVNRKAVRKANPDSTRATAIATTIKLPLSGRQRKTALPQK